MKPILEVKNMTMNFGGLCTLDSLDISIRKGEIAALIGPNGAISITDTGKNLLANEEVKKAYLGV